MQDQTTTRCGSACFSQAFDLGLVYAGSDNHKIWSCQSDRLTFTRVWSRLTLCRLRQHVVLMHCLSECDLMCAHFDYEQQLVHWLTDALQDHNCLITPVTPHLQTHTCIIRPASSHLHSRICSITAAISHLQHCTCDIAPAESLCSISLATLCLHGFWRTCKIAELLLQLKPAEHLCACRSESWWMISMAANMLPASIGCRSCIPCWSSTSTFIPIFKPCTAQ